MVWEEGENECVCVSIEGRECKRGRMIVKVKVNGVLGGAQTSILSSPLDPESGSVVEE